MSGSLTELGYTVQDQPKIWEAIARSLIILKDEHLKNGSLKDIVNDLAKAGYEDDEFWKQVKHLIVDNKNSIDGQTYIELRNTHVEYFPHQVAMISYLEQKAIASLFMFGKSHKHSLFHGASTSKFRKSMPAELQRSLKKLDGNKAQQLDRLAKQAATTIKKIIK